MTDPKSSEHLDTSLHARRHEERTQGERCGGSGWFLVDTAQEPCVGCPDCSPEAEQPRTFYEAELERGERIAEARAARYREALERLRGLVGWGDDAADEWWREQIRAALDPPEES